MSDSKTPVPSPPSSVNKYLIEGHLRLWHAHSSVAMALLKAGESEATTLVVADTLDELGHLFTKAVTDSQGLDLDKHNEETTKQNQVPIAVMALPTEIVAFALARITPNAAQIIRTQDPKPGYVYALVIGNGRSVLLMPKIDENPAKGQA